MSTCQHGVRDETNRKGTALTRKYIAVPLGVLVTLVAAAGAHGQVVLGGTSQSNEQNLDSTQAASQTAGGGIVLGGGDQNATNNSETTENNAQSVDAGLNLGNNTQTNDQSASTNQGVTQNAGGGTLTLLGGDQNAANNSA